MRIIICCSRNLRKFIQNCNFIIICSFYVWMDWHTCSALAARKYWRSKINIKHQYYCAALAWQGHSNYLSFLFVFLFKITFKWDLLSFNSSFSLLLFFVISTNIYSKEKTIYLVFHKFTWAPNWFNFFFLMLRMVN